jgi:xylose isomerase
VFAYAAAQVKEAIDATHSLGGLGYVFWGGREGYASLINTCMKSELDHLAALLHMAVAHKKKIGFTGQFYIEPKPREPSTHQYDSDAAACLNFLREYDLLKDFKLNIETNHATLAGHTMEHELTVAINAGALGSIDANQGDTLLGWDTDQFPTDLYGTTKVMLKVLEMGGFTTGGLNFDAKRRRESHEPLDLFHAHIGGMDAFARGLKIAAAVRADGRLAGFVTKRYESWQGPLGKKIASGSATLAELAEHVANNPEPKLASGRQELLENILNDLIR